MRLQYRKTGDTKLSQKPQKLRSAAYRREDGQILFEKTFISRARGGILLSRNGRNMERTQLNDLVRFIKKIGSENSDIAATVFKLAADSIALETLKSLSAQNKDFAAVIGKEEKSEEEKPVTLSFTKKELRSMPKSFQKIFIHDNKIVKFRYYNGFFQARYRRDGYNIEVSSKDFEKMKRKFIEKLTEQTEMRENGYVPNRRKGKNVLFADYAGEWLGLKEQTTKPSTFKEYSRMFETNLKPTFGNMRLSEITRPLVQRYLFTFVGEGKYRMAEKLKLMLSCIFDMAAEDFDLPSPMKKIVLPYHESKKGSALTKEEERKLVEYCRKRSDDVASALLVLLYFGLRQSELPSLKVIGDNTLECETSKERMGRNVTLRYIPFTPMFRKVQDLVDFGQAKSVNVYKLRSAFKRLFPNHHPHELRYTFITRCKECNVNHEVVMLWDGHSADKDVKTSVVDRGYTDYSQEYILAEAEKVNYDL